MEIEGLPETNAEIRAARSLQFFVNAHRDPKSTSGDYALKDFLPEWVTMSEKKEVRDDEEEIIDPAVQKRASEKMLAFGSLFG